MIGVGTRAPAFRLPSGQGLDVALDEYVGRCAVILLFAKGMACGFCRQQMSQLARGLPTFQGLGAEILMVTPTPVDRARFYAANFTLAFPYLSDPDYTVYRAYGLDPRSHSLGWYAHRLYLGVTTPKPETELGPARPTPAEIPRLLKDDDLGFFIVDRGGIVRLAQGGPYTTVEGGAQRIGKIPGNDVIARELERWRAS
jgi:peroxiredoxin